MKKAFIAATAILGFLTIASSAMAQEMFDATTSTPTPTVAIVSPSVTGVSRRAEVMQRVQTTVMDSLKSRANREIDRRVESLTKLTTRISELKFLSTDQKQAFTTNITTEINSLKALKDKINADTDITMLRADVKSIVTSYRIYALYMPQVNTLLAANRMNEIITKLNEVYTKLNTQMSEASAQGKDVSSLQTYLIDMKAKLDDAKLQNDKAIATVTALTPSGYPGNKTQLQNARGLLRIVRKDIVAAGQDARMITKTLRSLRVTGTPTSSNSGETTIVSKTP